VSTTTTTKLTMSTESFTDHLPANVVKNVEDLYKRVTPDDEFEFMFFNYQQGKNNNQMGFESFKQILQYLTHISKTDKSTKKHVPALDSAFIKYYESEKPQRFIQHKTVSKRQASRSKTKDNGDLTDLKTINQFGGKFEEQKADFVTADGGFNWKDENTQEQEAVPLILGQMLTAVKIQAKGGSFVCKLYETFTDVTVKLIVVLKRFYKNINMTKPLMSRKSNSEKYLVCTGYLFDAKSKERGERIKQLEEIMMEYSGKQKLNVTNFYPKYDPVLDADMKAMMVSLNNDLSNRQFDTVNRMITFIESQNYHGDVYRKSRDRQIEASKFWTEKFFPDVGKFADVKKKHEKFSQSVIDINKTRVGQMKKDLIAE